MELFYLRSRRTGETLRQMATMFKLQTFNTPQFFRGPVLVSAICGIDAEPWAVPKNVQHVQSIGQGPKGPKAFVGFELASSICACRLLRPKRLRLNDAGSDHWTYG